MNWLFEEEKMQTNSSAEICYLKQKLLNYAHKLLAECFMWLLIYIPEIPSPQITQ